MSPRASTNEAPCPCRTGGAPAATLSYAACCGRYHGGPEQGQAPTAEALMRSRYSAFVFNLTDYLLSTWHPSTRPASLAPLEAGLAWLGLDVRRHRALGDEAMVEFVARSKAAGGRANRLHETSRFVREGGHWFYVDGQWQEDGGRQSSKPSS